MTGIDSTFRANEPLLSDLLSRVKNGKTQLPDFQRGWVWDDNHIRALIASITMGYPIGAVMFMETGSESVRFKPRLLEGVALNSPPTQTISFWMGSRDSHHSTFPCSLANPSRPPMRRNRKSKGSTIWIWTSVSIPKQTDSTQWSPFRLKRC